jgi:hypothetical protein
MAFARGSYPDSREYKLLVAMEAILEADSDIAAIVKSVEITAPTFAHVYPRITLSMAAEAPGPDYGGVGGWVNNEMQVRFSVANSNMDMATCTKDLYWIVDTIKSVVRNNRGWDDGKPNAETSHILAIDYMDVSAAEEASNFEVWADIVVMVKIIEVDS